MRDSRSLAKRRRQLRRATLALTLLASTPVLADQPQNATLRMLPPLPLKAIGSNEPVQSNPFCKATHNQTGVQLASGTEFTPVRLKPIGTAVGLQEVSPTESAPAATSIVAPAVSAVRSNPMVGQTAPQAMADGSLGQDPIEASQTTIRLVRPNTQQPAPLQAAQQVTTPVLQGSDLAQLPATNKVDGSVAATPTNVIPEVATPTLVAVPQTPNFGQVAEEAESRAEKTTEQAQAEPTGAADVPSMVASTGMSNPIERPAGLVKETEPILFSFSDGSNLSAPKADDSEDSSEALSRNTSRRNSPESAAVTIAKPITTQAQSAPRSILQKVEPATDDAAGGFAAVKIAQPNVRAVVNPFVKEEASSKSDEPSELSFNDVDIENFADQDSSADDEISVLKVDASVILAEAPRISGALVDPIQLDVDTVDATPEAGSSILATSEESSADHSVLAPTQDFTEPESEEPIAIYRSEPVVAQPVTQGSDTLLSKRYRPPVEVKQVPIAFERVEVQDVKPAVVDSAVQPAARVASAAPVAEMKIDDLGVELGPEVKLTPLHMNQAQVRSLTLGGSVTNVRVGDKDICQAFASGPNQLKLIGTGAGVTRLVVWAAPDGENATTLMRAFEIHVGDIAPTEGEPVADTVHLLNSSIKRAFPTCRANVRLVRGELHVVGRCDNQESAKKIIRMVRKSCLIPVRDQLSVQ